MTESGSAPGEAGELGVIPVVKVDNGVVEVVTVGIGVDTVVMGVRVIVG